MTADEAKVVFDNMKKDGITDEEIIAKLYLMFTEDKLTLIEFEALGRVLGYELTEEFRNMSPEDQKTKGWEEEETEPEK